MIEARDVTVHAGGRALLERVSVSVAAGELLVLGGPNGAGKSTLLRTIAGELRPTSGTVLIGDARLESYVPRDLAKRRAVLGQHTRVAFPFLARAVVALGRGPHDGAAVSERIVDLAMVQTETGAFAMRRVTQLSGGEAQRVHLARVLAQVWEGPAPRALLLDEPTASLDAGHQHAVLRQARRFADEGSAVLCVLHDLNLASQYADRIVFLKAGKVVASGAPQAVLSPERLRDLFCIESVILRHPTLGFPVVIASGEAQKEQS